MAKLDKFPICKVIFAENNNFNENEEILIEGENMPNLPPKYDANIEFNFQRMVFPPFKVTRDEIYNLYCLEKKRNYECHIMYIFWRIRLILMRYYIWSNNVAFVLFFVC